MGDTYLKRIIEENLAFSWAAIEDESASPVLYAEMIGNYIFITSPEHWDINSMGDRSVKE